MNQQLTELARCLALHVRRDILAGTGGTILAPTPGAGLEFNDLREYRTEDDARHIHWPSLLAGTSPKLKVFREEQEVTECIALDNSASMTENPAKWNLATQTAALLAGVATLCGNGGFLIQFAHDMNNRTILKTGERELGRATRIILQKPEDQHARTQFSTALEALANALPKPTRLFLISDFLGDEALPQLRRLTHRHQVILCHILPDDLDELKELRGHDIQDAETGGRLFVSEQTNAQLQHWKDRTRTLAAKGKATYIHFNLQTPPLMTLRLATCQNNATKL